jgi:hypothetical protein
VRHVSGRQSRRNEDLGVRRRKRRCPADVSPIRRREIERLVKGLGLAGTDELSRFLMAWVWHNRKSSDPLWALKNTAISRMGISLTDADAREILDAAWDAYDRHYMTQDGLAEWLGLTYAVRERFCITTIGACDIGRAGREVLRKRKKRLYQAAKRRANGARPQSQSLSATRPWEELGMGRRTWYRRGNKAGTRVGTTSCPPFLSKAADEPVPTGEEAAAQTEYVAGKKQEDFRLATATVTAGDEPVPTGEEAAAQTEYVAGKKQEDFRLATATVTAGDVDEPLPIDFPISVVPCWIFGRRDTGLARAA